MLDEQDASNVDNKGIPFTVRSVFIIDPSKKIRLTLQYPVSASNFLKFLCVGRDCEGRELIYHRDAGLHR